MLLKGRSESEELLIMRCLNNRMELTEKDKFYYLNLEKGFEGEVKFDLLTDRLNGERYIIDDLLLEVNNSFFQIDKLIISQGVIHLLDIKHFQGDFYFDSDKLFSAATHREYKNPIDQLKRSGTLFRQLLQHLKKNYLVEPFVIFNNPEFTLYQAPMDQPIILPTQINRFLNELNNTPSKLNEGHKQLAQQLISLHHIENPFTKIPKYNDEDLRKGIPCEVCHSFSVKIEGKKCKCNDCGHEELVTTAVIRCVNELKLLYPNKKITTNDVYLWCQMMVSKNRIAAILQKNFKMIGTHQWAYYE
jgi:hypothetical protein